MEWLVGPSEGDLSQVANLFSTFWREVIPAEPDLALAELVAEIRQAPGHRRVLVAVAHNRREFTGAAEVVLDDLAGAQTKAWVKHLVVRPEHRRQGTGTALLSAIAERALAEGRSRLEASVATSHTPGMAFASAAGATTGLVDRQNRLRTERLDRALLESWIARAPERACDYSLVTFDGLCPEEWLAAFTQVISVMNTAPRAEGTEDVELTPEQVRNNEEAHLRRGGWGWTVCAAHGPTGELVAYTELGGSGHRPWLGIQGDTAVHPAHRDRGLGRWIKAVNGLRLLDDRPEVSVVETWNAGMNAPMLAINDAMGFRRVAEWQEWRLDLVSWRAAHKASSRSQTANIT